MEAVLFRGNAGCADEGDDGKMLCIEEIGTAQMVVTIFVVGVNAGSLQADLNFRSFGVFPNFDGPLKFRELSSYCGDHEAGDGKPDCRVDRVNIPDARDGQG